MALPPRAAAGSGHACRRHGGRGRPGTLSGSRSASAWTSAGWWSGSRPASWGSRAPPLPSTCSTAPPCPGSTCAGMGWRKAQRGLTRPLRAWLWMVHRGGPSIRMEHRSGTPPPRRAGQTPSSRAATSAPGPHDPVGVFCKRPHDRIDAGVSQGLSILAGLALGGSVGSGGGRGESP